MLDFFKKYIYTLFFRSLYFLGLTLLLPYILAVNAQFEISYFNPNTLLIVAISLITIGIVGMYFNKRSWKKTFFSLSLLTLIPGILSLLVILYGKSFILTLFEKSIISIEQFKPLIDAYLDRLPHLWILSISYILVGVALFFVGKKCRD